MSDLQFDSIEKTTPKAPRPERKKTDKFWIAGAVGALLLGFSATGALANDGLLGGGNGGLLGNIGNTVNSLTAGVTGSTSLDAALNGNGVAADLGTGVNGNAGVADSNLTTALNTDVNVSAQKQAQDLGLQGLAVNNSAASVNLSGAHQATRAHVTNSGAIVLGD